MHRDRKKDMKKKIRVLTLCTMLFALCSFAEAQQPTKIPTIGILAGASPPSARVDSFRREFLKLGYVEGKNIAFESRYADNKIDRLSSFAAELVRLKVDVIVTPGANDTRAAKNATKTIPIVFLGVVSDPVSLGLVDSLASPGGNITGFTSIGGVLAGKQLELLKETIPKLSRVAVLWNPQNGGSTQVWRESQPPAKELGLQLHSMAVNGANDIESGFRDSLKARSGALFVTGGGLIANNQKRIISLAIKNRLPAIAGHEDFAELGGFMSYGTDGIEPHRRAAVLVDKILKGAKPADLPVEQPKKFEFIVNLKTAKQIDVTIPPNVLARADKVIK